MKKQLLFIISIITLPIFTNAQINLDGTILQIDTCDTYILYDSGGPNGNYGNNENFTITLCPSIPNSQIKIEFLFEDLNDQYDLLCFYDGSTLSAPILGCLSQGSPANSIQASATNTSGCLTLQWTTDGQGTSPGFELEVSCQVPCQSFYSELVSSFPATDSLGYIDICPNETVTFSGQGNYFENDTLYTQADSTSTFKWLIEGVQYTGQTATHTFQNPGGHKVQLEITDAQGCKNTNILNQRVRVAPLPLFAGTTANPNTICIGDTVTLSGNITQQTQDFTSGGFSADTIELVFSAIPNVSTTQTSSIIIDGFYPGQTLNDTTEILAICTNIQYKGGEKLDLKLTCPSGQSMYLHKHWSLLSPPPYLDLGVVPVPSFYTLNVGYDYCWAPTATNPTMTNFAVAQTIIPGTYRADESFTNLLGCELNGEWELEFTNDYAGGYLFNWSIDFADSLYINNETFTPQTATKQWLPDSTIVSSIGDSIITVVPTQAGTAAYTFTMTNDYGCSYDTTITINVMPLTDGVCKNCDSVFSVPHLQDTAICAGESIDVDATITDNQNRTYTYTASGQPILTGDTLRAKITVANVLPNPFTTNGLESVCVDIEHDNPEDLDIYLVTPSGLKIELSTDNGVGVPNAYQNTCFSPTAATNIIAATAPYTGTYLPEQSFNIINVVNPNPNGIWTLEIRDDANFLSNGVLKSWSINFKNQENVQYVWASNPNLSCTYCPNPTITPTVTANYIVFIQSLGCLKKDTIKVTVLQPLAAPTITCNSATQTTLNFTWSAVPNAASYEVNVNNTGWQPSSDSLGHWVLGLSPNQTVNIQVRGVQNECTFPSGIGTASCTTLPCDVLLNLNSLQHITCPSGSDGSISLSANSTNLITNYFYQNTTTTDSSTTGFFNNLTAGNYLIIAIDSIGCTDTMTVILTEPMPIIANETIINNVCFGENNGSITLNPTGGTPPFSYLWSDNSTNNSLVNLVSDTYLVTITDGANCVFSTSFVITQPDSISTTLTTTLVTNCNGNDGTATVSATGGTPNYTYLWSNNDNFTTATNLISGTHYVTITDANNCIKIDAVTILEPEPITFSTNQTNLICHTNNLNGTPLGTITINVLSGTTYPSYEYSIDCGATWQNSNVFTNLSVGNYDATVRYSNATCAVNCQTINITEADSLALSFVTSQVTCYGLSDGTATVSAVGGNGNYAYLWNNNNQNTATATNLPGGFFEVTVTDGNTCQTSDTVYVYAPVLVFIDNISSTPTLCYGSNEGTISAIASGGTGAKTYTWTNNLNQIFTGSNVTNLYAQNYILTAADAQGCIAKDSVLVLQPDSLAATFTVDSLTCFNNNSGSASVNILGGTQPYSFIWNNNFNINQANNLPSNFAIVTITDANNCVLIDSVFIPQPLPLSLNLTATQVSCNGSNDGTATVTASGGTGIFNYLWSNNSQNNMINNLSGGMVYVTVSDENNCTANDSIFILEQPLLFVLENKNNVFCFNNNDGNITLSPNGGTGIYTYQWQNSTITDSILNNLSIGIYTYIVTDSDGCIYSDTVEITEPQPLNLSLISTNPTCLGGANGTATATVSGGTQPYHYTWSRQSQNAATVQNLTGGWINLTVTDANNCMITDSVFVQQPQPISIITTSIPITCIGGNDGTATATVSGGLGNYTYVWATQNGQNLHQNLATATNLQSGQYFVQATDTNNCTVTDSIFVTEPQPLEITPIFTPISCFGGSDGGIAISIKNINNYSFLWNTNISDTLYFISNLKKGNYSFEIKDSLNCITIDTIFLDEPTEITSNFEIKNISCFEKNDGEIKIQTTGGTPFYLYNFENKGFSNTNRFIGLDGGNYEIITKDANGCEVKDTVQVIEPQVITVDLGDYIFTEIGNQIEVNATVTNGIFPFIYHWLPADSLLSCADCSDVIITATEAIKRYDCIVTDANGCTAQDFILIRTHKNQTIFVANAFTPNGDGNNDVLFVQGNESTANATFQVFDRWGELVFETKNAPINDESFGWDGTFRNEKMSSGIFVWVVEVRFEDGRVERFRGSVFLMR